MRRSECSRPLAAPQPVPTSWSAADDHIAPLRWLDMLRTAEVEGNDDALECAHLEAEIAAARSRVVQARQLVEEHVAELRDVLRNDLVQSQQRLAELERQSSERIEQIHRSADTEIDRILSKARASAEAIRARAGSRVG